MVPFVSFLLPVLLLGSASAYSAYDPYLDAEQLYKMQLLANAFQYPGDKLGMNGMNGLGGGAMDVPYDLMGEASDSLSEVDGAGPAYWPEELVAELAAAAGREEGAEGILPEAGLQEEEEDEAPVEENVDDNSEVAEEEKEEDKQDEEGQQQPQHMLKGATKYSGAQLRDQEHMEHSALHGYQKVSGGTVNGQNKQTKSDKALPAYCNPPNPCPVGKTAAEDNCVENFENSAENNQRLLSEQECPCDTEHMFTCPEGGQTVSSKAQGSATAIGGGESGEGAPSGKQASQQMEINKVIAELSEMEHQGDGVENNPMFSSAQKRVTLVAKKSPHFIGKRSEGPIWKNPYLQGSRINIAAKKSPELAKNAFEEWKTL